MKIDFQKMLREYEIVKRVDGGFEEEMIDIDNAEWSMCKACKMVLDEAAERAELETKVIDKKAHYIVRKSSILKIKEEL